MEDHGISVNKHYLCTQPDCPFIGNGVLCVQIHLERTRHIPECIRCVLRPAIQALADQTVGISDSRPTPEFWEHVDKEEFVRKRSTGTTNRYRTSPLIATAYSRWRTAPIYQELMVFKNDSEFHQASFGRCCKYDDWMQKGVVVGDLLMLGLEHAKKGGRESVYTQFMNQQLNETLNLG